MPLPINSVAQAFTEQQQRQADIGATQAGTLQRLMQVAIGNYELKNAQRQQEAQDQMRNYLMQQEMYQGAVGNPNTSDPNAKSLAASAQEESAVDRSVRELTAKSGYYDRLLRQAMLLNDVNAVKELRVLSDNATTQLREARKEKTADEYKKIDYLGGLAYNAGSPDDVADFVREVARVQGPAAAAQLVQGGNGVPGLRADPQDPQRFLFGDPERAALSRYVARSTQAKEQAQIYHWRTTDEQAKAEFADRQQRTASLIADRNSRIAARQHGVQLPGGTGNLEATPGAKVASINLVPGEGSSYTEADIRQMQNDIARDAGVGSPATTAATGVAGYGVDYTGMDARRQATVDWYATMQLAGDSTWRVGLSRSKQGSELIKAVDERVPEKAAELGLSAADIGTNKAIRVSNQAALTQITKDIATLKPYVNMLDQNSDILAGLADKAIATNAALANRPINWLRTHATDNPDVAEYLAQIEIVKNEATRVISNPRLVGQMTDTARQEIEAIINGTMPINATKRVLERIKNDGDRRIGTMETQQKHIQSTLKEMFPTGAGGAKQESETPAPQKKVIKWSDLP